MTSVEVPGVGSWMAGSLVRTSPLLKIARRYDVRKVNFLILIVSYQELRCRPPGSEP